MINSVTIIREGNEAENFDANKIFKSAQEELAKINAEKAKKAAQAMKELTKGAKTTKSGLAYIILKREWCSSRSW